MKEKINYDNIFPQNINILTNKTVEIITQTVHPELWDEYVVNVMLKLTEAKEKLFNSPIMGSQLIAEVDDKITTIQSQQRYKVIIQRV